MANKYDKLEGVNWGVNVIDKDDWIDPSGGYTCDGRRVVNLRRIIHNNCGREVTYPIKGSIVVKEKPFKTVFATWSLDGRFDVVWPKHTKDLKRL